MSQTVTDKVCTAVFSGYITRENGSVAVMLICISQWIQWSRLDAKDKHTSCTWTNALRCACEAGRLLKTHFTTTVALKILHFTQVLSRSKMTCVDWKGGKQMHSQSKYRLSLQNRADNFYKLLFVEFQDVWQEQETGNYFNWELYKKSNTPSDTLLHCVYTVFPFLRPQLQHKSYYLWLTHQLKLQLAFAFPHFFK